MLPTRAPKTPTIDRSACPADRHGTASAARNHRCRCVDARRLLKVQRHRRASGRPSDPYVDAIGTIRRRQALLAIGWSCETIAAEAGLTLRTVQCMNRYGGRTRASSAARMLRAYRRLLSLPRPTGPGVPQLIGQARRLGYQPPEVWSSDDEMDDPAALPDTAYRRPDDDYEPTALELREMLELGWSLAAIVERTKLADAAAAKRLEHAATATPAARTIPADTVYAIRDEYLRTRHTTWKGKAVAARYGVSTWLVSTVIHGTTRPELGLTDLTVQQGGHTSAATPTGRENRKGTAA